MEAENKALSHFKDWSNYLLVTTVAALGWVSSDKCPSNIDKWCKLFSIGSFAVSTVCAIFTLALIPLIAEQQTSKHNSFYDVEASFYLFRKSRNLNVRKVCFPQHVFFILGILFFALGTMTIPIR